MNGGGSGSAEARWIERAAHDLAIEEERSTAEADQGASDADQTTSDADQTASERDEADAVSDQATADLEQAQAQLHDSSGSPRTALEQEELGHARDATRARRQVTHATRAETAHTRLGASAGRDATAAARDQTAGQWDLRAHAVERALAKSDAPLAEKLERLRIQAAADRARASADRARAAEDRRVAAFERAALEAALNSAYVDELTGPFAAGSGCSRWATRSTAPAWRRPPRLRVRRRRRPQAHQRPRRPCGGRPSAPEARLDHADQPGLFDPIVRYGGDEFVCALGAADVPDVERRFERINMSLQAGVGATISVGLVALAEGETLDDVLAARTQACSMPSRGEALGERRCGRRSDTRQRLARHAQSG